MYLLTPHPPTHSQTDRQTGTKKRSNFFDKPYSKFDKQKKPCGKGGGGDLKKKKGGKK